MIDPKRTVELEATLSDILNASATVLSGCQRAMVEQYIYHREYELALEIAAASYAENGVIATLEVQDMLRRLATSLKIDPFPILAWATNQRKAYS